MVARWRYTVKDTEPTAARLSAFIYLAMSDIDYFGEVRAVSYIPVMISPSSIESLMEIRMRDGQTYEIVVRKKEGV